MPKFWKFFIGFLVIMLLVGGGYFVWNRYFSPRAKQNRQEQENIQKYQSWQAEYEKAMTEDTFGGKTPEETLKMFIEALKKGDIDLASKYFVLEDNMNDPNYLTRKKWEEGLRKAKEEKRLSEIVNVLLKAKPDLQAAISNEHYVLSARDEKGIVIADIDLHFNKYSQVWKIESL